MSCSYDLDQTAANQNGTKDDTSKVRKACTSCSIDLPHVDFMNFRVECGTK